MSLELIKLFVNYALDIYSDPEMDVFTDQQKREIIDRVTQQSYVEIKKEATGQLVIEHVYELIDSGVSLKEILEILKRTSKSNQNTFKPQLTKLKLKWNRFKDDLTND